jgi:hypothetical protein
MSKKITTESKDTIEVITIDSYTGEGAEEITISINNKLCRDSSSIDLNESEVRRLRDLLNEWLEE